MKRLITLPETRRAVVAVGRSPELRVLAHRAIHDRAGLLRDVRHPGDPRALLRRVVRHPAAVELARTGLLFVPVRYGPVGWVATWAARRALDRHARSVADGPTEPPQGQHAPQGPDGTGRPPSPGAQSVSSKEPANI